MHLRHIVCTDAFAGAERYVCSVAVELARRGHRVEVLGGEPRRMRAELGGHGIAHVPAPSAAAAARANLRRPRPDLIHTHMTAADSAAVATTALVRRPIISTLHFAQPRGHSPLTRALYRGLRPFLATEIAISDTAAAAAGGHPTVLLNGVPDPLAETAGPGRAGQGRVGPGRPRQASATEPDGSERRIPGQATPSGPAADDTPADTAAEWRTGEGADDATATTAGVPPGAPRGRPVVVMVQRLEAEKRTELGLRAFAASGLADEGWELHVLGEGAERPTLERLAAELGLAPATGPGPSATGHRNAVRFLGLVDDVPARLTSAALFLAPRPDEPFGLSVVEAMAAGVCVIAAEGGGHRETIGRATPDTLFPPDDVNTAAALLRRFAHDESARHERAQLARRHYVANLTIERHVDQLEALYRQLLT